MLFKHTTFENVTDCVFQAYIKSDYNTLINIFGEPTSLYETNGITCQWNLLFEDGVVATIYDYHDNKDQFKTPKEDFRWCIGGNCSKAVLYVYTIFYKNLN